MRNIDMLNMNTNTLPQGHETEKELTLTTTLDCHA